MAAEHGDIEGKSLLDVGCGTGALSVAASFFGPSRVVGIDIDEEAGDIYMRNAEKYSLPRCEFVCGDIRTCSLEERFDTAVINPPFGTKGNEGIDVAFVEFGLRHAQVVYSMHKTSTRKYVLEKFREKGARAVAQMRFEIKRSYRFHQKSSVHIDVDLVRFISRGRCEV
jgi:rRNA N6-adenosine-methyltransferase METTL5